jgi:hypothetical protein
MGEIVAELANDYIDVNRVGSDEPAPGTPRESWLDEASQEVDDAEVEDYDIVASPNDWNFATIVNFIESGAVRIPAFQRNYVWDKKRASKLIESLLIGLPVPQVFLYEEGRNDFLVIDGQQRLLTLYFYAKGRFPKPQIRGAIRATLGKGLLDAEFLEDDDFFEPFKLTLPKSPGGKPNRFHGLTYKGLKDDKRNLDFRTLRNIVVKQTSPAGNSAVFEIFNRLNSGGVNLSPQEIRASLYHSTLFTSVIDLNQSESWRQLVGQPNPDTRMRDTEFLLRGLALAHDLDEFRGSMSNFVNKYCLDARKYTDTRAQEAAAELAQFMALFAGSPADVFMRGTGNKFSGVLFESFFAAWVRQGSPELDVQAIVKAVHDVKNSRDFSDTLQEGSTKATNIKRRIAQAEDALATASRQS